MPENPANPTRPPSRNTREDGSGVGVTPSAAKPVAKAPLEPSAGKLVTKMWAAASFPSAFATNTFAAEDQVPPVFVNVKLIVSDECVNPSKLFTVWLKTPKPSTFPEPPSLSGPGVKPTPALDAVKLPMVHMVALTLTSTEPPSPSR